MNPVISTFAYFGLAWMLVSMIETVQISSATILETAGEFVMIMTAVPSVFGL